MSFTPFNLHPSLMKGVSDLGFTSPTPIQKDGIPPALEGRNVLACAMTGSGKPQLSRFRFCSAWWAPNAAARAR
jgi:superfamily II DNA/RNA helicase